MEVCNYMNCNCMHVHMHVHMHALFMHMFVGVCVIECMLMLHVHACMHACSFASYSIKYFLTLNLIHYFTAALSTKRDPSNQQNVMSNITTKKKQLTDINHSITFNSI